jgi:hypothetical protein
MATNLPNQPPIAPVLNAPVLNAPSNPPVPSKGRSKLFWILVVTGVIIVLIALGALVPVIKAQLETNKLNSQINEIDERIKNRTTTTSTAKTTTKTTPLITTKTTPHITTKTA